MSIIIYLFILGNLNSKGRKLVFTQVDGEVTSFYLQSIKWSEESELEDLDSIF